MCQQKYVNNGGYFVSCKQHYYWPDQFPADQLSGKWFKSCHLFSSLLTDEHPQLSLSSQFLEKQNIWNSHFLASSNAIIFVVLKDKISL